MHNEPGELPLARGRIPPSFERRVVVVHPGREIAFDESEWRGAVVVVERGAIEVECRSGARRRFERGAVLWLCGLRLRVLRQRGGDPAVLVAVFRRCGSAATSRAGGPRPPTR